MKILCFLKKEKIKNIKEKLFEKFKQFKKRKIKFEEEKIFYPLGPIDTVDEQNIYFNKFQTAIKCYGCHIIAFTGRYCVGKTSVINSILKKMGNKTNSIRISLGNYKNADETGGDLDSIDSNEIETKILQQIIYTTDEKKLPLSRFKRIKYFDKIEKIGLFIISFLVMNLIYLYYDKFYNVIIGSIYNNCFPILGCNLSILICILALLLILYTVYKILFFIVQRINIASLKYKNLEMSFENTNDKSIFNKYLDEIVYYFKQTKTRILVIEDLDRYGNVSLEIFTKLKELNFLLNANATIKKCGGVVFIYALRDDLFFNSEDRVKFFDCIIPVVSKFSSQNAKEYIMELYSPFKENFKIEIDEKLLRIVSYYIHDRRLLSNIFMEFKTYFDILRDNQKINYTELFALICYKNINPTDFENRLRCKGDLYKIFDKKNYFIGILNDGLLQENIIINSEIQNMLKCQKNDIVDIKKAFLFDAIRNKNWYCEVNRIKIYIDDREFDFESFLNHEFNLERIKSSTFYTMLNGSKQSIASELKDNFIKKIENLNYDFALKNEQIESNIKSIDINNAKSLEELLKEENLLDLIEDNDIKKIFENKLLISLIKNGFIKENYEKSLSYFKSGDLSNNDYEYLISVDINSKLDFDYEISNIEEVINQIETKDFKKEIILNNNICDSLLLSEKNQAKKKNLLNQLQNISEYKLRFLENYLYHNESNFCELIKKIITPEICLSVIKDTSIIKDKKKWLKILLENVEYENNSKVLDEYRSYLEKNSKILNDFTINDIFKNNILKIKPVLDNYSDIDLKIIELLYSNGIFNITESFFLKLLALYEINCDKNYSGFLDIIYNNDCLKKFKDNILISPEFNNLYTSFEIYNSSESNIIKFLNETNKLESNIKLVLEKESNKITNINDIIDKALWKDVIDYDKCDASMDNLISYYEQVESIDDSVENLLYKIGNKFSKIDNPLFQKFENDLLYSSFKLSIDYETIANEFDYEIFGLSQDLRVNEELLGHLIAKDKIEFTVDIYNYFISKKELSQLTSIVLNRIDSFINIFDDIEMDYTIVDNVFQSSIDFSKKIRLLNKVDLHKVSKKSLSKFVLEIIKNNARLDNQIVNRLFNNLNDEDKINYFILLHEQDISNIRYLHEINDNISKIRNGKSVKIALAYSLTHEKLVKYLKSKEIINKYEIKKDNIHVSFNKTII